jgi:tRNA threonylcarbamoyladenosine biosynthesis protein TsaB
MTTLIALATGGACTSYALMQDREVLATRTLDGERAPGEVLLECLAADLAHHRLGGRTIDGIAVTTGPGAFTGVRMGLSIAQGLALAWGLPLLPVSSLAALAWPLRTFNGPVLALLDARMGELYAGWYASSGAGGQVALAQEHLATAQDLALAPGGGGYAVIGSGYAVAAKAVDERLGPPALVDATASPGAVAVAELALTGWPGLARDPGEVVPVYLRDKVALTMLERNTARDTA